MPPKEKKKKEKKLRTEIVQCPACSGNKVIEKGVDCQSCQGRGVFLRVGTDMVYYWDKKVLGISPSVHSIFKMFSKGIRLLIYFLVLVTSLYGIYFIVVSNPKFVINFEKGLRLITGSDSEYVVQLFLAISLFFQHFVKAFFVIFEERGFGPLVFWIGVLGSMYCYYYLKIKDASRKVIDFSSSDFEVFTSKYADKIKGNVDISNYISASAMEILKEALCLAHSLKQVPSIFHLAKIVSQNSQIEVLFKRLEIDSKEFSRYINILIKDVPKNDYYNQEGIFNSTVMSPQLEKVILVAFYETVIMGMEKIHTESFFLTFFGDDSLSKYFKDLNIEVEDARKTVLWVNSWANTRVRLDRPRKISHSVMNKAWTARVTPELDSFTYDLTDQARSGMMGNIVDREKELDNLMRILERTSKNNALLIGEEGSGRSTIVKKLANRMVKDQVLPTLRDKRLVVLDVGSLVSGAGVGGNFEGRIRAMIDDMGKSGNIILFIPNIHDISAAGSGGGFDASKVLSPIFSQGIFQVIGSTDYRNYHRYIEPRADFANSFDFVKVEEMDENQAIEVLAVRAKIIEAREGIVMTYGAIKSAVELSKRYITNRILPGKAIDLLSETAVEVRRRGSGSVLRDQDIMEVITEKTGIPLTNINSNEAEKLMDLEENLHQRVIGQKDAVKAIASSIRRVRVGMKNENRPIGTFLFLGPTGVGKTELAKALAEAYFGDEDAMIRVDMSEYQTLDSVEKLIGSSSDLSDSSMGGVLTEAVKRKPFSLVLLDELEKADKNVFNIFLQVFDDGRLTDNLGRTVDFTNTIIIATSNAGSKVISKIVVDEDNSNERILQMLEPYLLQSFAPEFLNRFTARIVFRSLSQKDVMAITKLQIKNLAKRMDKAQGIKIKISGGALKIIAELGYSAEYGARFLQRTIQEKVENLIATKFLKGEIKRGDVFEIKKEDL
ncbi:MAG: ATP-dependent Clp protease ATP-binding subunit [Candidatus Pacebacteria bacterium]|nr:ATP-dependent Clp protease ATP-binding subunit [Candidatus Paceibacterota bacterium]